MPRLKATPSEIQKHLSFLEETPRRIAACTTGLDEPRLRQPAGARHPVVAGFGVGARGDNFRARHLLSKTPIFHSVWNPPGFTRPLRPWRIVQPEPVPAHGGDVLMGRVEFG